MHYTAYLDGVSVGGFQVFGYLYAVNPPQMGAAYVIPAGGGDCPDGFLQFVMNPNAIPSVQAANPTTKGLTLVTGISPSKPDPFATIISGPVVTQIKLWFGTIQLKLQHNDGSAVVPVTDRWVGGGLANAWTGLPFLYGTDHDITEAQLWCHGDGDYRNYGLTDSSGVLTVYILWGYSLYGQDINGNPAWFDITPASHIAGDDFGTFSSLSTSGTGVQNLQFNLRRQEIGVGLSPAAYPDYVWQQQVHLPSFNYGTAWDGSGNLTVPALSNPYIANPPGSPPESYTQASPPTGYKAWADIRINDTSDTPVVGATVSFGGGAYTGTTTSQTISGKAYGRVVIPCNPKGNFVEPPLPAASGAATTLPLRSAAGYTSSPPLLELVTNGGKRLTLAYGGVSSNSLTGVSPLVSGNSATSLDYSELLGGEIPTEPYTDLTITAGGLTYTLGTAEDYLYIHEDGTTLWYHLRDGHGGDNSQDSAGLDYAVDPFSEPHLLEGRDPEVWTWESGDMERDFSHVKALSDSAKSLSAVILPDHRRLLVAVQSGAVRQWVTDDAWSTDQSGTSTLLDNSATWTKSLLRAAPDGSLHAFLSTAAGAVSYRTSRDGGDTWDTLASAGLPTQRDERGDARHDGREWLRAHPEGTTHGLKLYSSPDGEGWTLEGAISTDGNFPLLLVLPDGRLLCAYHDGTDIVTRTATDASGSWVWTSPVTLAACNPTGPAGFANGQKVVLCWHTAKNALRFAVSVDGGDTWTLDKSEG